MEAGTFVTLRESSVYATNVDRHNPVNVIGVVVSTDIPWNDNKRTNDLPVLVNWGNFTNTYKFRDLQIV